MTQFYAYHCILECKINTNTHTHISRKLDLLLQDKNQYVSIKPCALAVARIFKMLLNDNGLVLKRWVLT